MSTTIGLLADGMMAVLLVATIGTCVALNKRIVRLKADESAMRKTISELVLATETAERAIAGLRTTLGDCDRTLAERLRTAERYAADLSEQVSAGEGVMSRIAQIVEASQLVAPAKAANEQTPPALEAAPEVSRAASRLSAAASTAQKLAERALKRLEGQAA
ncbi:DUF6468 domain-containing protein [Chelatococcus sp. SYSU_G07232]|uniref:DUF6468 domain-containing protein n=1 Tax=Chelatococcus albus TaxID=3047466 RepID=A0ABT7AGF1_9HYPH|nr:DUF6468 domain-containing protein [Chelatococcus sp. SYSU_G07232]MDJ1158447.1 DUF6468 domain-containing protein [Chelatococcus sp. SYSU_G07232]